MVPDISEVGRQTTIYQLPIEVHDGYAAQQTLYEALLSDRLIGPSERIASLQVQEESDRPLLSHLASLFQTHVRVVIAVFPKMARLVSGYFKNRLGTPHLGTLEERERLLMRLQQLYHQEGSEVVKDLIRALEIAIEDRKWCQWIQSKIAGGCAA